MAAAELHPEKLHERHIESDDQAFIEALVSENHQEVYWKSWVQLYTKANAAAKKERILVVTNFRLFTIKQGVIKRSTRQSFHMFDLEEITASETHDNEVHFVFQGQEVDIRSEKVVEIVQSVLFAFKSITYGLPASKAPKVDLPARFMDGFIPPAPDTQDGLLATYLAMCDYNSTAPKLPILDYFMTSFESGNKILDVGECLRPVEKAGVNDIMTVASAVRYTNWFDELVTVDYPIRDEGLVHLACVFGTLPQLTKCVLVNVKAGAKGFSALADTLATGHHGLTYLNVAKNKDLGDAGVKALFEALLASKKVLETVSVQSCGFSTRGFKALMDVAQQPAWLSGLRVLDVSDNSAGKAGTQILCDFIKESRALQQFYAMRTDLQLEMFLEALVANKTLSSSVLQTLNLSGNKISKKAMPFLVDLLRHSTAFSHLYLVDTGLTRQMLTELLEPAIANTSGVRFWLELSSNGLGDKGAQDIAEVFQRHAHLRSLHTLILNNNGIGPEGVIPLAESLVGKELHTLSLDNNIKTGMFSMAKAKEAGDALAKLVQSSAELRELSISGDDSHYLQSAAYPILEVLKSNTSLRHLDLSRNRLGDDGIKILADALMTNTSLTSFNAERNRLTLKGLSDLHKAIISNSTLVDWAIPLVDIENIVRSSPPKTVQELKSMVFDFEQCMDRNWEKIHASEASASAPDEESKDVMPSGADGLLAPPARTAGRRVSQFRGKYHARNASEMFDNLTKERPPGEAGGDGERVGEEDPKPEDDAARMT